MKLKLLIAALVVFSGGWVVATQFGVPWWLSQQTRIDAPAPDLTLAETWLVRPTVQPSAVWEDGWQIDVFVLPPRPALMIPAGAVDAMAVDVRETQLAQTAVFREQLASLGDVYMPAARVPSAATKAGDWSAAEIDIAAAFRAYLDTDNRGRAVIIAVSPGADAKLDALTEIVRADDALSQRMLGSVTMAERVSELDVSALCNAELADSCQLILPAEPGTSPLQWVLPRLPGAAVDWQIADGDATTLQINSYRDERLAALEASIAKSAEPFGDFHSVEISPINRPREAGE